MYFNIDKMANAGLGSFFLKTTALIIFLQKNERFPNVRHAERQDK